MIERHEEDGFTAVYLTADWEPTDPGTAVMVKLVYDDGRVQFLTSPDAEPAAEADPVVEDDNGEHEHDGSAWDKHRAKLAPKTLKIYGHGLATWARAIHSQDAQRIATAIQVGISAGESNTDIAHRVIGSRRNNGVDGMTEITRQHIYRLGHGLLNKRKSRMRGASSDV